MKKLFTLMAAAVMATAMWAVSPTTYVQKQHTLPQDQSKATTLDVQKVQATFATELSTFKALPESAIDCQSVGTTKISRKASVAESPIAFYMQPEGTLFGSIDKAGMGLFMEFPSIIGTWMNGVDAWKWRNYSQDYTKIEYQNAFGIALPEYADLANEIDADGNWLDTLPAQEKFDPDSYFSYRVPLQIVSNGIEKDSFAALTYTSHQLDTLIDGMWTISGAKMSEAFSNSEYLSKIYDNFPEFKTPFWPMTQAKFYDIALEEDEPFFEFLYNYDKTAKTYQYVMGSTAFEIKKQDKSTVTYQPAGALQIFEKPMSPLYVHDVTVPIGAVSWEGDKLMSATPTFDKMQMTIMSIDGKNIYAQTLATIEDTTDLGGISLVNFKIEKEDEFGGKEIGVTLTDSFVVAVSWTNNAANNFGVCCGLNTITGGMTLVYDANSKNYQHYFNGDAFITLNGIYNTLVDGADMYGGVPADTVDVVMVEEDGYYFAYYKQEDVSELPPVVVALDLLYDTLTYQYNYDNIVAPDWAELYMEYDVPVDQEGYTAWDYGFYFLDIVYDPEGDSEEVPAVGDEIKLKQYGQEIVYRIVEVPPFTALEETKVTVKNGKRYDVLGRQVGKDYKSVMLMNNAKYLQK